MTEFQDLPLGQPIPGGRHAVSCSLPTMADVIAYEAKDPAVASRINSGYPRFVVHSLIRDTARVLAEKLDCGEEEQVWPTTSLRLARQMAVHLGDGAVRTFEHPPLAGVIASADAETAAVAKAFLQHTGGLISSRQAEDFLIAAGRLEDRHPEEYAAVRPDQAVTTKAATAFGLDRIDTVLPSNCGMNAFYAVYRALSAYQAARGRTLWIQLGWLYLDTISILEKFAVVPEGRIFVADVTDRQGLERLFRERGSEIAGIVTELPTNPLLQTADLPAVAELARQHGALVIADPSVCSPTNTRVFPYADVAVASLTKYAANQGDVIAGAVAVNPERAEAGEWTDAIGAELEPVYWRDIARLAMQLERWDPLVRTVNKSTPKIVEFLESHPAVDRVWWARRKDTAENYATLATSPEAGGGMVTFTLKGPLDAFYDRVRLAKGPSFGIETTLLCPFMYLAHFNMVRSESGRAELRSHGLEPDLLRLAIGAEPVESIIGELDRALNLSVQR